MDDALRYFYRVEVPACSDTFTKSTDMRVSQYKSAHLFFFLKSINLFPKAWLLTETSIYILKTTLISWALASNICRDLRNNCWFFSYFLTVICLPVYMFLVYWNTTWLYNIENFFIIIYKPVLLLNRNRSFTRSPSPDHNCQTINLYS